MCGSVISGSLIAGLHLESTVRVTQWTPVYIFGTTCRATSYCDVVVVSLHSGGFDFSILYHGLRKQVTGGTRKMD